MAAVPFPSVIEALGGAISSPLASSPNWAFYEVKYPTPAGPMLAHYLYLHHRCPLNEASTTNLARWRALAPDPAGYEVVVATRSDLAKNIRRTKDEFRGRTASTTQELLHQNVLSRFTPQQLDDVATPYFITPDLGLPDGQSKPALSYLLSWLRDAVPRETDPAVTVLIAGAGLGKTTLSRALATSFRDAKGSGAIPILVESEQWRNLIQPNLTLDNVLTAALLRTLPEAGVLTNPNIFHVLVRERLLVPIFDGFDELCLHPNSAYTPGRLLAEMLELLGDSGARVLITSRETFWEKHRHEVIELSLNLNELKLQGFSNSQRQEFFQKRLKSLAERDTANRIARDIGGSAYPGVPREPAQALRPNGVPLVLELIAVYVDGNPTATFAPDSADSLGPLLQSLCLREMFRQQLPIPDAIQMNIFEELFRDYPEEISPETLELYVQVHSPGITPDVLARFESHALLSPGPPLRPRFEILTVYFVARWLAHQLENVLLAEGATRTVAGVLARHAAGNTDVLDWLEDRFSRLDPAKRHAAITHAREMIRSSPYSDGACSALFHLTARIGRRLEPDRSARTAFVAQHFAATRTPVCFRGLAVQGQIDGLDLRDVIFEDDVFRDVEFKNCRFNGESHFVRCRFDGQLDFEGCEHVAEVDFRDCVLSFYAERTWDRILGRRSRPQVTDVLVRDALRDALRKFLGPYGFATIKYQDRNAGPLGRNPLLAKHMWDELVRAGVVGRHEISGVREGGLHVAKEDDIRHEVRVFLDNAALGPKLRGVVERLAQTA